MTWSIIHGDCHEVLSKWPDNSVHMILCDPPYGRTRNFWDTPLHNSELWPQYLRICDGAIVMTATQPYASLLITEASAYFRHEWIWCKNKATGHLNAQRGPMRAHESVLVFGREPVLYQPQMTLGQRKSNSARRSKGSCYGNLEGKYEGSSERYPTTLLYFDVVNNDSSERYHATQKPVALLEYLIRTYTHEGDTVLDNCMGSGSTGVAAINTRRNFIGIDREISYCNIATMRLVSASELSKTSANTAIT